MVNSGDCRAESSQMCSVSSRDFTGIILMLVENEFIHTTNQLTKKVDHQQGAIQESCALLKLLSADVASIRRYKSRPSRFHSDRRTCMSA